MAKRESKRGNVIRFPVEAVSKLGFERAQPGGHRRGRSRSARLERAGQMNLFEPGVAPALGEVVRLPLQLGPFEEALLLDELGDERAEDMYLQAIEKEDCTADAWCNLGVLRSLAGRADDAFDCFTRSLAEDPRHAESHYNIGNVYFEMGDLRLARAHYEIAAGLEPDFVNVHFNLGLVTALAEDYPAAYRAFARYRDLAPDPEARVADELLESIRSVIRSS